MKTKSMKLPVFIIVIGIIVAILASLFVCVAKVPTITEHDFSYSATYKLNGETKTVEGVYRCRFTNTSGDYDPTERYYEGTYVSENSAKGASEHVIATKDNLDLAIVFIFTADFLMGDGEFGETYENTISEPYVAVFDNVEGYEYTEPEMLEKFDVELVSWELPQPVENSFVFSHIAHFSYTVVYPALGAAILALLAIIIFVKKQEQSERTVIDTVSIVLNFVIAATLLPFVTIIAVLIDVNGGGTEIYRQILYFIPAFITFCLAASVALRRRGHAVKSLVAELIGPVAFGILLIVCAAFGLL